MKRPSKKAIRDAVDKLKDKTAGMPGSEPIVNKLTPKKTSQRIRKQGI